MLIVPSAFLNAVGSEQILMIEVEQLRKNYGDFQAVKDISFTINKGEIVGFLGPNGAGKTTTMRILTGFLEATSGSARLAGFDIAKSPLEVRRRIGYLPESAPLYLEMKVREFLMFLATVHGIDRVKRLARVKEVAELTGIADRLGTDIGHLSKGLRQRVGLCQAMIHDPDILILDEPTSGLDPNQRVEIRGLIKDIGKHKTVILSTHILPEAEATCDRAIIIHEGAIVASGTLEELRGGGVDVQVIRIAVEGSAKGIEDDLKNVDGVVRVLRSDESNTAATKLDVEFEGSRDPRKELMKVLMDGGYDLLEMARENKSFEDVFARLTGKQDN
jgi:ABC-2 type transport system ATP-binding protein